MKLLLIEDDEILANLVVEELTQQKQYIVEWSNNGLEGLELAKTYEYDLILLDVALPELDGIQVCQQLRNQGNATPILLLTAHDNITKKVAGLDAGADDYLVKPFDVRELLARIRALSRRNNDVLLSILQWENLILDPNNCQVLYQETPLKLTAKEYSLLELFLRHPQRIFNQNSLIEKIWTWEESPSENAVRTQIKGLRHKLKEAGLNQDMIETVYGLGYRLKEAPQVSLAEKTDRFAVLNSLNSYSSNSVDKIWQKYQSQYRDRVIILQRTAQAIKENNLNLSLKEQAISTAHTLVGSLGSFGYLESSQICAEIRNILQSNHNLSLELGNQLEHLLVQLLIQFDSPPENRKITIGHDEPNMTYSNLTSQYKLLIVDDDFPLTQALVSEAFTWGIEAHVAGSLSQARQAIASATPDAILLDLSFPEANNGGLELLQELTNNHLSIPVIALTARESFADRVEVARLGGKGFLTKPISPTHAIETVASILEKSDASDATILVVDNHQENLAAIAKSLQPGNFEIILLQDTRQFWDILESSNPDLIIAQLEMDNINGIELCQVVRNDPRWCHLPIILISPNDNLDTIQQICSVGVDDHLSLPIVEEELLARISNRLDKERYHRHLADTDPLTGIANRRASLKELTRLLRLAQRQNKPWCFVAMDLDDFKHINDTFGHDAGDRVLRRLGQLLKQEFRREDAISRWGGEEFILGMYDMTKKAVIARLQAFLTTFRQQKFYDSHNNLFHVTFSAGVAEYPLDGTTLEALYKFADTALYQAKEAGKNCII